MTTILLQGKSHQYSDKLANTAAPKSDTSHSAFLSGVVWPTIPLLSTILDIQMHRLEFMITTENTQ